MYNVLVYNNGQYSIQHNMFHYFQMMFNYHFYIIVLAKVYIVLDNFNGCIIRYIMYKLEICHAPINMMNVGQKLINNIRTRIQRLISF